MQQTTIEPTVAPVGHQKAQFPNMENPVVTASPWQAGYHAVYASLDCCIGITFSASGEPASWQPEQHLVSSHAT